MKISNSIILCLISSFCLTSLAEIKILKPAGKRLQIPVNTKLSIQGTAKANTALTISCGKIEVKTKSDSKGKWQIEFPFKTAGWNLDFTIAGNNEATTIKANVMKPGDYFKTNYAKGKKYNFAYTGKNGKVPVISNKPAALNLTDGKIKKYYNQNKTLNDEVCWKFKNAGKITITIDLQKSVTINEIKIHAMFIKGYYTLSAPQKITIKTSTSGKHWGNFAEWTNPPAKHADGKRGCHFSWQGASRPTEARYVKVSLTNDEYNQYNQAISVDEIQVLGYTRK